jgi:hypothetical protein
MKKLIFGLLLFLSISSFGQERTRDNGWLVIRYKQEMVDSTVFTNKVQFGDQTDYIDSIYVNADTLYFVLGSDTYKAFKAQGGSAVSSVFTRTGAVVSATSDYDAIQVDNTPSGGIVATNVQTALNELDSEISTNTGNISNNSDSIAAHRTDIAANTGNIATNTSNIAGKMSISTYDPTAVSGDAFDMDNMVDGSANEVLTKTTQTFTGVKTFNSFPVTPSSAPTTDYQAANKKYVDDNTGGLSIGGSTTEVQFNLNDTLAGNSSIVIDDANNKLRVGLISGGSATHPAITLGTNSGTGLFSDDGKVRFSVGGATQLYFNANGLFSVNSGGVAIHKNAATATFPNIQMDWGDGNTGLGHSGSDAGSLIAGGVEIAQFREGTSIQQLFLDPAGNRVATTSNVTLAISATDDGFYSPSAQQIRMVLGGTVRWNFNGNFYESPNSNAARVTNVASTSTVPVFINNKGDITSGVGGATGEVSAIIGSTEALTVFSDRIGLYSAVKTDTGDPSSPASGDITINEFDNVIKIYADGAWRTLVSW